MVVGAERPVGGFGLADSAVCGTVGFGDFALEDKSTLEMGVAKKSDGDGIGDERIEGVSDADQVLVFVDGGAVDELEAGEFVYADGALRESTEPFEIFGRELVPGPEGGDAGDGVEVFQVHEAADGFVMIAADEDASEGADAGDDFVGIGGVADGIAEVDDEVGSGSSGQTSVERLEVAVNVAEEKDAHGKARIIA